MSISALKLSEATSEQVIEISTRIHILLAELYADQMGMKKPEVKLNERRQANAS